MTHQGYAIFLAMLRKSRTDMGLTQAEVAKRLNVAQSYVSKAESGARRLDVVELFAWLDAVDADWMTFTLTLGHALEQQGIQRFPDE